MGRKIMKWKKIFSNYISDNFSPKYMKEFPKVSNTNKYRNIKMSQCFPCGTVVKNLPANAGDTGSSPGLGRSHMPRGN